MKNFFLICLLALSVLPHQARAQRTAGNLKIINQTGAQINLVYVSPPTKGWGNDALGTDVYLPNGEERTVDLTNWGSNCTFDLKASDENSNEYYLWGKNFCTSRQVTLDESHLLVRAESDESGNTQVSGESTTFRNTHSESIFYLYAVPATRANDNEIEWGTDLLGDGTLQSGDTFDAQIDRGDNCFFDIKAEASEHALVQVLRRVNVCETSEITIGAETYVDAVSKTFSVQNNSGESIMYLRISPVGADNFGEDLLGDDTISDGDAFDVTYQTQDTEACNVDLKAERGEGDVILILKDVNICDNETLTIGVGLDQSNSILVKNTAAKTIYYLYISKTTNWGDDRLGDNVIITNDQERVRFNEASGSNCRFNIKVEGSEHVLIKTLRNINLCTTREITIQ